MLALKEIKGLKAMEIKAVEGPDAAAFAGQLLPALACMHALACARYLTCRQDNPRIFGGEVQRSQDVKMNSLYENLQSGQLSDYYNISC